MDNLVNFINETLNPISIVLSLVLAIPVFSTWYEIVWGKRYRLRRWHKQIMQESGLRPSILILDLLPGKRIGLAVENFRQQDVALKTIPADRIFKLEWNTPLTQASLLALQQALNHIITEVANCGTNRIHCFYAGPGAAATIAGAELANGAPVILYQYDAGQGVYQKLGAMQPGFNHS